MDSITSLIKSEIKAQYKSLSKFSEVSGIPYSTLSNALSKGIGGTSYDTVVKICDLLNIKQIYDDQISMFNNQFYEICSMLCKLDEQGIHTVRTVLEIEYNRCSNEGSDISVKGFNGISFATKNNEDRKYDEIRRLVDEVKKNE